MGLGTRDEENPVSDEENEEEAERKRLNPLPPEQEGMELKKIPVQTKDASYREVIVGQNDPLIKSHHLKYLLLGFNCFLTLLGLVLLSISIWISADPDIWEYDANLDVDNFQTACIMFIVASLIIIIVGFLGCVGAVTERRWLIYVYIVIFGLIFLLQLAAVILMWSAPYSPSITRELEKQIQNKIDNRVTSDTSRRFTDFIQFHLECCGAISSNDYKGNEVPNSCQSSVTGNIYEVGCATKMLTYLRNKAGIIGGLALPILLVQLLALLAAGCLVKSLDVETQYFMK